VVSVVFFGGAGAFLFVLTVFFQIGLSYSAFETGLVFVPFAVGFSASAIVSGLIANRIGPRVINIGSFWMALSLFRAIALIRHHDSVVATMTDPHLIVAIFLVYGIGQGLAQPSLINTVIGSAGVTGEDAGSAVGLFLTAAQSIIALGIAVIGDVFFSWLGAAPTTTNYLAALSAALTCNFVLLVAAFALALMLPREAPQPHRRNAA
jgi:MFS family permease